MQRKYAEFIGVGSKTYEVRPAGPSVRALRSGDVVAFHWYHKTRLLCKVQSVALYDTIEALVAKVGFAKLVPDAENDAACCAAWSVDVYCVTFSKLS